ncbi:MAG: hypothetical protein JO060_02220 [Candidatus Eremiobacteraeota bacterium]|nr:hypothetical protein [Candidatus Eremiobacteraeota bacterium]
MPGASNVGVGTMPRSNPKRSDYCASRHLLRHLDDPKELRRNPLVASYFPTPNMSRHRPPSEDRDALVAIKQRVFAALAGVVNEKSDAICARDRTRAHAILLRCEVQQQPRGLVAAELALSLRAFQIARCLAHRLFLSMLRKEHAAVAARSRAKLALDAAAEVALRGELGVAVGTLMAVENAASAPSERVEALCEHAHIELQRFSFERTAQLLAQARGLLPECGDLEASNAAVLRIALVQAMLERLTGIGAQNGLPPTLNQALASIQDGGACADAMLKSRLHTLAVQYQFEVGSRANGIANGRLAARHLRDAGESGLALHELRMATADLESIGDPDLARCETIYREASAWAESREYPALALRARASQLAVDLAAGRIKRRTYRTRALRLLQEVDEAAGAIGRRVQLVVFDQICEGLLTSNTPHRTLQFCDRLERMAPSGGFDAARIHLYRSFAMAQLCRYDEAEKAAAEAVAAAQRINNPRLVSSGKLFLGLSIGRQGFRSAALAQIDAALPALSRCGTPWQIREAAALRWSIAHRRGAMRPLSKNGAGAKGERGRLTAFG